MAVVRGSRNPRIGALEDAGPVADERETHGLRLRFRPTPSQTEALARLLDDQQNPASPMYHVWLTPEEFGERFGLSTADFGRVRDWLELQGFQINGASRSRTFLSFSGTAGQIRMAFRTQLHHYRAGDRTYYANPTEALVPADLEPLLFDITGLDDLESGFNTRVKPAYTLPNGQHRLAPADLATIYNITPLYESGLDGAGQTIVIPGHTDFHLEDVQSYRAQLGLPKNDPKRILVPDSLNPGKDNDAEALLDLQIAGAIAPKATVVFVFAQSFWVAVQYAIDENLGTIISTSVGGCEAYALALGSTDVLRFLAQQANAQGITWVAGSGDSGAAGCEEQQKNPAGISGMAVAIASSIPEVTGVGGTTFAEGTGTYWSDTSGAGLSSALSYIPETAWNDTEYEGGLAASGGGRSAVYPRPTWQNAPGVPEDNARHVPDIAFTASWDHDSYLMVYHGNLTRNGGTSATGPLFAGILALLNQHVVRSGLQDRPGLGNVNPRLYQLARTAPDVFHDITSGDNIVPCKAGTLDCESSGRYGYLAGPGYDHATGLGSIDVEKLFRNWGAAPMRPY